MKSFCGFGCGQEAKYELKNGKMCCSKSPNSCHIRRKINSEGVIKSFEKRVIWNKGNKLVCRLKHPTKEVLVIKNISDKKLIGDISEGAGEFWNLLEIDYHMI